jgi:hypothetical protein
MRVRSDIWVKAYLRRCQSEAVSVVIVRRGDDAAGAIFISVDRLDGTVFLYGPAPAGLVESEAERRWISCFGSQSVVEEKAKDYLRRQQKFDPDLWIIEVEDKAGRHFLGDLVVEN